MLFLFPLVFVLGGIAHAAAMNTFTVSGAALTTDGTCTGGPPGGYLHCYILTIPQVDPLGLTATTFNKYPVAPTGFVFAATLSMNIRRGATYNNQVIAVAVDVAPGFTHSALLTPQSCFTNCTTAASFTTITTTRTTQSNPIEAAAIPLYLAVNVAELNGASAWGGADLATVEVTATSGNATSTDRIKIQVNNVATALSFKMSYAPGGTTDYTTDFGNVNGLGIGGVTVPATGIYAPGVVYYQSYTITPIFANFNPVSVGYPTITAWVSTAFAPAAAASTLHLCDATAVMGACTVLGTTQATANQLFTSVVNRSTNTRALGLIVQATNGATAYPGNGPKSTSAIVTFEILVQ